MKSCYKMLSASKQNNPIDSTIRGDYIMSIDIYHELAKEL